MASAKKDNDKKDNDKKDNDKDDYFDYNVGGFFGALDEACDIANRDKNELKAVKDELKAVKDETVIVALLQKHSARRKLAQTVIDHLTGVNKILKRDGVNMLAAAFQTYLNNHDELKDDIKIRYGAYDLKLSSFEKIPDNIVKLVEKLGCAHNAQYQSFGLDGPDGCAQIEYKADDSCFSKLVIDTTWSIDLDVIDKPVRDNGFVQDMFSAAHDRLLRARRLRRYLQLVMQVVNLHGLQACVAGLTRFIDNQWYLTNDWSNSDEDYNMSYSLDVATIIRGTGFTCHAIERGAGSGFIQKFQIDF
jgi:hypothetical protein